jgi:predicted nucleic acid-binding protein
VVVLDSSLLVAAERDDVAFVELLGDDLRSESVAIATITASELLHGVHRAADTKRKSRREATVERILSLVPVLAFDLVVARVHARLWAELAAKGRSVGAHDLIVGATALTYESAVVTRDERSFPKIPGLRVLVR